jgi:predicted CXXCH cytochrome family protein
MVAAITASLVVGAFVMTASGATTQLDPNANFAVTNWTNVGGASHWNSVSDAVDTTYISGNTTSRAMFDLTSPTYGGPITGVTVTVRANRQEWQAASVSGVLSDGTNYSTAAAQTTTQNAWVERTYTFANDPAGGTWDWSDIPNLKAGAVCSAARQMWISKVYVTITYTPNALTVGDGTTLSTPTNVSPGDQNVVIDAFTLGTSASVGTVSTITVTKTGTAAVSAVDIYSDANGNGVVDGADASVGTGAFGSPITINRAVTTTPAAYLVVADIDAAAADASSVTGLVTAATGTGIDTYTYSDTTSRTANVVHTKVTIGDGSNDPAAAFVAPGQTGVAVDQFTTQRTQGTKASTLNTVTVTKTGTAAIATAYVYSDAGTLGVIDGADASLGSAAFSGNTAVVDIPDQTVDGTIRSYLVVYDIPGGATDGQTATAEITAATHSNIDTLTESDNVGSTFTVAVPTAVTVGDNAAKDPGAASVAPGQGNVSVDAFTLQRTAGSKASTVSALQVSASGAAPATDVSAVDVYLDNNNDGLYDAGDTKLNTTSATFTGSTATVTLTTPRAISGLENYIIVYGFSAGAVNGHTVTGEISGATTTNVDTLVDNDDAGNAFTVLTNILTIDSPATEPAAANVTAGQLNVPVDAFRMTRSQGLSSVTVLTLTVTKTGAMPISAVDIYTDTNFNGVIDGADASIGTASFSGATAAIDIVDQVLTDATTKGFQVVYDVDGSATPGQTATAEISALTQSGAHSVVENDAPGNTFTVAASDTEAPTVPADVTAVAGGASPTIAVIAWSASADNVAVTGYKVWRSTTSGGVYTEIGATGAATLTFDDTSGVPGQEYFYRVSARDAIPNWSALSSASAGVTATWVAPPLPHAAYTYATQLCAVCHEPHVAPASKNLLRTTGELTQSSLCYTCHDGSSASNVKTGGTNSFALSSGHTVENLESGGDLTNVCAGCHNPHRDYTSADGLPGVTVNGVTVGTEPNAWCLACHNAADAWYGPTYPGSATPSVDDTGYPTLGTFPTDGASTVAYTLPSNAHLAIPALSGETTRVAGDCLYCHASHRGESAYDGLIAKFQPSTAGTLVQDQAQGDYATLCFQCHGTKPGGVLPLPVAGATDIQQFATAGGPRSGHRIKTSGGTYPVGAPLPCYECHNPHGSARSNRQMLSDALGDSLETTTVAGEEHLVREFCFTCHTTAGSASGGDGLAYGWDSAGAGSYTTAIASGKKIAGLARDAAVGANVLRLPAVNGHYRDDAQSCYKCHGSNYGAGGNNVHNPSGGVSQGGEACYNCHSDYQTYMEDGTAPKVGAERATVYHHVMGGTPGAGYKDGDFAPGPAGVYPSSLYDLYCVSCHVDHDKFNATPGSNLRKDFSSTEGANTDFGSGGFNGGLCTSCHGLNVNKANPDGTGQKSDTLVVTQAISSALYSASPHQYQVASEFGSGNTFLADCSKCHTDEQQKDYQTSTYKFGTHYSASNRLLTAFGASVSSPLAESHCYGCHNGDVAGNDYYGTAPMNQAARSIKTEFTGAGIVSRHPVQAAGGDSVECESCHNVHRVTDTTQKVSDPANTYNNYTYGGASADDNQPVFCLKCHGDSSGSAVLPVQESSVTTYVPYTVTQNGAGTASGANNKATYKARAHWSDTTPIGGAIASGERVSCAECHDNHASTAPKLLGQFNAADSSNYIGATKITANNNTVCVACHTSSSTSFPAGETQREASTGYFKTGTWPGMTTYNASAHGNGTTGAQWPASTYARGDCKNCHDVHGTATVYDEIRSVIVAGNPVASFGAANYKACFNCHDADGPATDIAQDYPTVTGGTDDGTRSGHRVLSSVVGANLAQNAAVPCYDCHNPHGSASSYGLQVRDLGDEVGDAFDMVTPATRAANVRNFCFACHVPSDINEGWADTGAGAGWVALTTEAVEGIARTNASYKLKLPVLDDHTKAGTSDCLDCHASPHAPTGGISEGGVACYGCHKAYKETMDADGTSKTLTYHHVLGTGGGTYSGGTAFASGSYPAAGTDVYCLSCHVDHDQFNATPGSNLRNGMTASPSAASSDYNSTNGGVCLGCHSAARAKDTTNQKSDGTSTTPAISSAAYSGKAHDYTVSSSFGGSSFSANCVKCHNDEQTKLYQTSTSKFGTHWSAERRLLSALGGTLADPLEESLCLRCHSGASTNDYYGAATMDAASRAVAAQLALTYTHDVDNATRKLHRPDENQTYISANKHVECEDCHSPHAAGKTNDTVGGANGNAIGASSPVAGVTGIAPTYPAEQANTTTLGTRWVAPTGYTSVNSSSYEYQICLKCHSGANTSLASWGGAGAAAWTNVALEFNPDNASYHPVMAATKDAARINRSATWYRAPWTNIGAQTMACTDCHQSSTASTTAQGPHGSAINHVLRGYWPTNASGNLYTLGGSYTGLLCDTCHNMATIDGLWRAHGSHGGETCIECHIVVQHGSALYGLCGDSDGTMPARYAYQANKANSGLSGYSGDPSDSGSCEGNGCSRHSNNNTAWDW